MNDGRPKIVVKTEFWPIAEYLIGQSVVELSGRCEILLDHLIADIQLAHWI